MKRKWIWYGLCHKPRRTDVFLAASREGLTEALYMYVSKTWFRTGIPYSPRSFTPAQAIGAYFTAMSVKPLRQRETLETGRAYVYPANYRAKL